MLSKIVFLILIFPVPILMQVPVPIFDSKTQTELDIFTHTYYAIRHANTGVYISIDDHGNLNGVDANIDLEIFADNYWFYFERNPESKANSYFIINNDFKLEVQIQKYRDYTLSCVNCFAGGFGWINECDTESHPGVGISFGCFDRPYIVYQDVRCDSAWQFESAINISNKNYNVMSQMTDFTYEKLDQDTIDQHKKTSILLEESIQNCNPEETSQKLTVDKGITQSYSLNIAPELTWSSKYCNKFGINTEVSPEDIGITSHISRSAEFNLEIGLNKRGQNDTWTYTTISRIANDETINIAPWKCMNVTVNYIYISNIIAKYNSTVFVNIERKSKEKMTLDEKKKLGRFYFFNQEFTGTDQLQFKIGGNITITLGTDIQKTIKEVGNNCSCHSELPTNAKKSFIDKFKVKLKITKELAFKTTAPTPDNNKKSVPTSPKPNRKVIPTAPAPTPKASQKRGKQGKFSKIKKKILRIFDTIRGKN